MVIYLQVLEMNFHCRQKDTFVLRLTGVKADIQLAKQWKEALLDVSRHSVIIALINGGENRFSCRLNIVDSLDVSR